MARFRSTEQLELSIVYASRLHKHVRLGAVVCSLFMIVFLRMWSSYIAGSRQFLVHKLSTCVYNCLILHPLIMWVFLCCAFLQVRGLMPSDSSLRDYLNICKTFSTLAMQSLRTMTEERVGGYERITKNFLNSDTFKDLAMKPRVQALYLQIYSR